MEQGGDPFKSRQFYFIINNFLSCFYSEGSWLVDKNVINNFHFPVPKYQNCQQLMPKGVLKMPKLSAINHNKCQ